jgi:hypothetical protein
VKRRLSKKQNQFAFEKIPINFGRGEYEQFNYNKPEVGILWNILNSIIHNHQ